MSEERLAEIAGFWLIRRANGVHYICWNDKAAKQRRYVSTREKDFQAAETALAKHAITSGEAPSNLGPERMSIHEALLRYYEERGKKLASEESIRIHCAWWSSFYEDDAVVTDLTPSKQEAFHEFLLGNGHSKSYAHKIISTGRAALNFCHKKQYLSAVPKITTFLTKQEKRAAIPRGRPMSLKEIGALLNAFGPETGTDHIVKFILVMLTTMCRPAAALDLETAQIDHEMGAVDLNPESRVQTHKYRPIVHLTPTMEFITSDISGRIVNIDGNPVPSVRSDWENGRERAKLDRRVLPYSLRHTMTRQLIKRGISVDERSLMLGHSMPEREMTRIYGPAVLTEIVRAAKAINEVMEELQQYTRHPLFPAAVAQQPPAIAMDLGPTVVPFRRRA